MVYIAYSTHAVRGKVDFMGSWRGQFNFQVTHYYNAEFTLTQDKMWQYEKHMLLQYARSMWKTGRVCIIQHWNTGSLLLHDFVIVSFKITKDMIRSSAQRHLESTDWRLAFPPSRINASHPYQHFNIQQGPNHILKIKYYSFCRIYTM